MLRGTAQAGQHTRTAWHTFHRRIHVFRDVKTLRDHRTTLRRNGESVGLVPTMGALHAGHVSLVEKAAAENDRVFVSIYVNPTQFGVNEDLNSYPKTWASDMEQLEELDLRLKAKHYGRVDTVFAPTTKTMYPTLPPDSTLPGKGSFVTITPLAQYLEGKSRPVFFRGVATVCMKLFNIVQPENVYFGQKDAQQSVIIKRMVKDFHLNTNVCIIPTEREADGLAMSSRNVYLGQRRREAGILLRRALETAEEAYAVGRTSNEDILDPAIKVLNTTRRILRDLPPEKRVDIDLDYLELSDPESLESLEQVDPKQGALLSGAIKMLPLGTTSHGEVLGLGDDKVAVRLIDNILLPPRGQ